MRGAPSGGGEAPACPNCGCANVEAYCARCGQSQESPRKRWSEHVNEIASTYLGLDMKAARTFWLSGRRPGELSDLQLQNRGGDYVTPLKLFLIVVLLYSVFFAFSPIKYGQFYLALESEWYPDEVSAPGDWGHSILVYAPELQDAVSPGFRAAVEQGVIDLEQQPRWIARIVTDTQKMQAVRDWGAVVLVYLPLAVIPILVAVNGFLFRKRYMLFDHFYLAFESAAMMIVVIMLTASITSLLYAAGVVLDEVVPYALIELPLLLFYFTVVCRRFYGIGGWRAFGDAFLIVFLYAAAQDVIYYPALEILGRLV